MPRQDADKASGAGQSGRSGESSYSIRELAAAAGTTPRTIRYYLLEGLMPPPGMRGRYAAYSRDHLNRLRLIQRLKDAFLPLAAIREQLDGLTPEQIGLLAEDNVHLLPEDEQGAAQYLAHILESQALRTKRASTEGRRALWIGGNRAAPPEPALDSPADKHRSAMWRRVEVAEGVELHVAEGTQLEDIDGLVEFVRSRIRHV